MLRAIKVYGQPNSGTNYLSALLRLNIDLPQLAGTVPRALGRSPEWMRDGWFAATRRRNLGWKHAAAPSSEQLARWDARGVLFVTLTKNPYSWILSMHRRPYRRLGPVPNLLSFITSPWRAVGRGNAGRAFASPVDLWNATNASYLALPDAANFHYEGLLRDPQGTIIGLAARHGLPRCGPFANVDRPVKTVGEGKTFDDYRRYYLDELWRETLGPEHIAAINQRLDPEVMRAFGYARIETTEAGHPEVTRA